MRTKYVWSAVGMIGAASLLLFTGFQKAPSEPLGLPQPTVEAAETKEQLIQKWLPCNFYEEASFQKSVARAAAYSNHGKIKVGIIPHHLLADVQIASFFQTAAQESYDTVVMLSTMHFSKASGLIAAEEHWKTPFGILEQDTELLHQLLRMKGIDITCDGAAMAEDHGNAGLMPYVKYYFPHAKIVNLLVSPNLSVQQEKAVVETLFSMNKQKNLLVIGSIDFSHYLSPTAAEKMDWETMQAVEGFHLDVIHQFGDEHLDSPKCMRIVLKYLQGLGIRQIHRLDHTSSDRLIPAAEQHPIFQEGTTTYLIYSGNE